MKLQLTHPMEKPLATQSFGANPTMYAKPIYGGIKGHNGIDFLASHGMPVYASHDGVASYQIDDGSGHGIVITTDKMFEYKDGQAYFKTIYWHLCDGLKEPQFKSLIENMTNIPVKNGDLIGHADSTGASTGDHLHFGLKPMNVNYENLEQNNGYLGAINPEPYFDGSDPSTIKNLTEQIWTLKKILDLLKQKLSLWK